MSAAQIQFREQLNEKEGEEEAQRENNRRKPQEDAVAPSSLNRRFTVFWSTYKDFGDQVERFQKCCVILILNFICLTSEEAGECHNQTLTTFWSFSNTNTQYLLMKYRKNTVLSPFLGWQNSAFCLSVATLQRRNGDLDLSYTYHLEDDRGLNFDSCLFVYLASKSLLFNETNSL